MINFEQVDSLWLDVLAELLTMVLFLLVVDGVVFANSFHLFNIPHLQHPPITSTSLKQNKKNGYMYGLLFYQYLRVQNIATQKKILISMGSFIFKQNPNNQPINITINPPLTPLHSPQTIKCQHEPSDEKVSAVGTMTNNNSDMCQQILRNNKKGSLKRKNSRQSNYSALGLVDKENKNKQQDQQIQLNSKLKYFENNKKLVESSIEATMCVDKMLALLCHREILQNHQFNYLNAKNRRSLECKQKRYRNLEVRQQKAILSLAPIDSNKISRQSLCERKSIHARTRRYSKSTLGLSQAFC